MSVASRPVSTGKTRTCPHCKATILESLSICPGCMHHLRFDSEAAKRQVAAAPALRVEGIIRHPPLDQPQEYFVIIAIRNDRGEEVTRQVVGVGALQPSEKRTFSLSVEVLPPQAPPAAKSAPTGKQAASSTAAVAAANPSGSTGTFAAVSPVQPAAGQSTDPSVSGTFKTAGSPASSPLPPAAPAGVTPATPGAAARPAPGVPPAAPGTSATPKATYPGGLKPPTPGAPRPPMPGGFKKH